MRWLLLKDLQILRRSPLSGGAAGRSTRSLIAVLVGFALSRGPEKPRVAFLNEVPAGTPRQSSAATKFDRSRRRRASSARGSTASGVERRREARQKVESGDVLAALILPPDLVTSSTRSRPEPRAAERRSPVNEEDPVKAELVDDRISSLLTQANLRIAKEVSHDRPPATSTC